MSSSSAVDNQSVSAGCRASVSDLLVRSSGSYEKWTTAVLDTLEKDVEARRDKLTAFAQVNMWYVLITRKTSPRPQFPESARNMIASFLGGAREKPSIVSAGDLKQITNQRRNQERQKAFAYYVSLCEKIADGGGGELEITQEVVDKAPTHQGGFRVGLDYVLHAWARAGYEVYDSDHGWLGVGSYIDEEQRGNLPYFARWENEHDEQGVRVSADMALGVAGRNAQAPNAEKPHLSVFFKQFLRVVEETRDKIVERITQLINDEMSKGNTVLELTREIVDGFPKLPNGKDYPFSHPDVQALHSKLNQSACSIVTRAYLMDGVRFDKDLFYGLSTEELLPLKVLIRF